VNAPAATAQLVFTALSAIRDVPLLDPTGPWVWGIDGKDDLRELPLKLKISTEPPRKGRNVSIVGAANSEPARH